MLQADIILKSDHIFTGLEDSCCSGFVAVRENKIIAAGAGSGEEYRGDQTAVFDLTGQVICPGFVDAHCFFTGYLLTIAGADLQECQTEEEVLAKAAEYQKSLKPGSTLLARGL